jgi:hypothetical protein
MTNIDDCAAQVASEFASGKCPNRFFEHDPTDGDCDCCADEQFDNPTSNYSLYEVVSGGGDPFTEFKMGFYCSSQSGHGLTNYSSIEECAAAAADKFADGTCTNSQGLIEYDPGDGDCNCCVDGTSFTSSSYYDIYQVNMGGSGSGSSSTVSDVADCERKCNMDKSCAEF